MKIKEENFALTWDEIDLLILQATDLLNRDSVLFNRMLWATEIAGSDDYKSILRRSHRTCRCWTLRSHRRSNRRWDPD